MIAIWGTLSPLVLQHHSILLYKSQCICNDNWSYGCNNRFVCVLYHLDENAKLKFLSCQVLGMCVCSKFCLTVFKICKFQIFLKDHIMQFRAENSEFHGYSSSSMLQGYSMQYFKIFFLVSIQPWLQIVFYQKSGLWLVDQKGRPIRGLFWRETTWALVLTLIQEKSENYFNMSKRLWTKTRQVGA